MKKFFTLMLVSALSTGAFAENKSDKVKEENKKADAKTSEKIVEKQKTIVKEAVSAMKESQQALSYLDENKKKEAQEAIQSAVGTLETVVARKPSLGMAAFDVTIMSHALLNDAESVNKLREQAISALENNRIQEARKIVSNLKSETVITVANIPLATYPDALKDAARLIDQNKLDMAKAEIVSALGTIVFTETVIPIPLARADYFLDQAAKLSSKSNRSKEENNKLSMFIDQGRSSLKMAEALGYVPKDAFSESYAKLDEAANKVKDGKSGNWFKEVKEKVSNYFPLGDTMQAQEEK